MFKSQLSYFAFFVVFGFVVMATAGVTFCQETKADSETEFIKNNQFFMYQVVQLLNDADIAGQLEIVESQKSALQKAISSHQLNTQQSLLKLQRLILDPKESDENKDAARKLHQTKMVELAKKTVKTIEDTLLPHQVQRLREISLQRQLVFESGLKDDFGVFYSIVERMELTSSVKADIKKNILAIRNKYYSDLEKLKRRSRSEAINAFPNESREKLKQLIGDLFERSKSRPKDSKTQG